MKALFIASHCDDELCFAGAILNTINPTCLFLSYCDSDQLKEENKEAMDVLGVKEPNYMIGSMEVRRFKQGQMNDFLYEIRDNYDTVFTHSINDRHPDHSMVGRESLRIFNCNILTYIGPWNGEDNSNYFIELTEEQLEKKIHALACYKSQVNRLYMNPEFIRAQARYNGIKCGKLYAEGFKVVRLIQ